MSQVTFNANREQSRWLAGLFLHQYAVKFAEEKPCFGFYAELLDKVGVPLWVQNKVSFLATKKENGGKYLRHLVKSEGIILS